MTLPDAARYLGRITGSTPHVSTLWRWCLRGCKGVRLDSICIGGKRFVTTAALGQFIEATSSMQEPTVTEVVVTRNSSPQVTRRNERRRSEIDAARRRLDELTGANKPPPRKTGATRSAG